MDGSRRGVGMGMIGVCDDQNGRVPSAVSSKSRVATVALSSLRSRVSGIICYSAS